MPKAAVVLPLPLPVWTIRRPFSPVLVAMILSRAAFFLRIFSAMPDVFGLVGPGGNLGHAVSFCVVASNSAIRSAARLERGVQSPRWIASAKRAAVSPSAAGLAAGHEVRTRSSCR